MHIRKTSKKEIIRNFLFLLTTITILLSTISFIPTVEAQTPHTLTGRACYGNIAIPADGANITVYDTRNGFTTTI